jgi:hypothetical protein
MLKERTRNPKEVGMKTLRRTEECQYKVDKHVHPDRVEPRPVNKENPKAGHAVQHIRTSVGISCGLKSPSDKWPVPPHNERRGNPWPRHNTIARLDENDLANNQGTDS